MFAVVIQLIWLIAGPWLILDSEPEISEVDGDIDPALRPFYVAGYTFAKDFVWSSAQ